MKLVDMVMPPMGESIMECTVLNWLKQPGEAVEADDSILEVATDKVDTEVPSPYSGKLVEILVNEGDVIAIGNVVARLEVSDSVEAPAMHKEKASLLEQAEAEPEEAEVLEQKMQSIGLPNLSAPSQSSMESGTETDVNNGFFSPLVQSIAKEEGISMEELKSIQGTGAEQRVTKKDIFRFLEARSSAPAPAALKPASQPVQSGKGNVEIVEMDRMRRMISQRMLDSKSISAHVTSFIETDMTSIVLWRNEIKSEFRKQTGESITFTPILIEAVVKAIKAYPLINVSVDGDKLLVKKDINIGMAVALPDGNLIVPVIHQADQYNLVGLAKKVNDLARKARENRLKADDLAGGTYTISNIGTFGNIMGTPIIMQPQVAIMAFGAIQKKPAVIETPQGDLLGIRHKMFISHSYDHRVVDGSLGGMFLKKVSDNLEEFDPKRPIV
jgi:2-oxoglutarate dehydrogenase E2 component (dihydrolipoamide succinyltransferase)